jgi:hypothetical protein
MSLTATTRLGLIGWSDRTADGPTMAEFNSNWAILDNLVATGASGPLSARPLPGSGNALYLATDVGAVFYDNGSSWVCIGSVVAGTQAVVAASGQTANLQEYRDASNNVLAKVDTTGTFTGHFADTNLWTSPTFGPNVSNAAGYYYGTQGLRSGDTVQVRGDIATSAFVNVGGVLVQLTTAFTPRDTQTFPAYNGVGFTPVRLTGYQDASGSGLPAGSISAVAALNAGQVLNLNLTYLIH